MVSCRILGHAAEVPRLEQPAEARQEEQGRAEESRQGLGFRV